MSDRRHLAQAAIAEALNTRLQCGLSLIDAICVYDICARLDLAVWFSDIPSMEGLYLPGARPKPAIVVTSLRPRGRQSITCGHELGHHRFNHGEQWDELIENRSDVRQYDGNEYQVDLYSAVLHMPKVAVSHALSLRKIDLTSCSPAVIYALSCWFGVGYSTLVLHLERTLEMITLSRATNLRAHRPMDIRAQILGAPSPQDLIVVDSHWSNKAIDISVGDTILLPPDCFAEGKSIAVSEGSRNWTRVDGTAPGIGRVECRKSKWAAFVRVMPKNYKGLAAYRFEEEVLDDE
jgi:hypothetical protein